MKQLILAGSALNALIIPAFAADIAPYYKAPPIFSWAGIYLGGNAGWGSLQDNGAPFCVNPTGVLDGPGCVTNNVPGAQANGDGILFGGQAGYNWQAGNWVFGVETDIQNADLNGSVNITGPFRIVGGGPSASVSNFTADEKLSWFGTLRGRAGVAWDRSLFYATVGLAYGGVTVDQDTILPSVAYPSTASATKTGWIAGGGWEFALTGNWSGKIDCSQPEPGPGGLWFAMPARCFEDQIATMTLTEVKKSRQQFEECVAEGLRIPKLAKSRKLRSEPCACMRDEAVAENRELPKVPG